MKKRPSKNKILVTNPFQRKVSKSPSKDLMQESKIMKNESGISQKGCEELAQIISLL